MTIREQIVEEAMTFMKTPYHHKGMLKGIGVDCLSFIYLVYLNVGLIEKIEIPHYPPDFNLHDPSETYLEGILNNTSAHEVSDPLPGDIVLYKFGKKYAHSALVIKWPIVIHAVSGGCVQLEDASICGFLKQKNGVIREHKFLSMVE